MRATKSTSPLRRLIVVVALLAVVASSAAARSRLTGGVTAFVNVRVVSMNPEARKKVAKKQTVIVEDGRIVKIGKKNKVDVPANAEIIEGRNKLHVLPGLADMHAHNREVPQVPEGVSAEEVYTFYLANGITTLFDVAGFKDEFKWRKDINRGKHVGPTLYFSTPIIDEIDYESLEALEADIRKWEGQGYAYIKSHAIGTTEFFERLHELGREFNLPVVGHALRGEVFEETQFSIQDTLDQEPLMIAHVEEIRATSVVGQPDFEGQLEAPLRDVSNSRVWVTSTVETYENIANHRDDTTFAALFDRPEMRYVPPSARMAWETGGRYRGPDFAGSDRSFWLSELDILLYIVRRLAELGSLDRLLLGTDAGGPPSIVPGFSIHDELRLLVQAGLTPWEAILTGTYNPAAFFEVENDVGTVEEGKRADLVVAKKNPLKEIGRLQDLAGVMVNGVWLSEADLDERLEALAARWAE